MGPLNVTSIDLPAASSCYQCMRLVLEIRVLRPCGNTGYEWIPDGVAEILHDDLLYDRA